MWREVTLKRESPVIRNVQLVDVLTVDLRKHLRPRKENVGDFAQSSPVVPGTRNLTKRAFAVPEDKCVDKGSESRCAEKI